jgi:hypothetical protein
MTRTEGMRVMKVALMRRRFSARQAKGVHPLLDVVAGLPLLVALFGSDLATTAGLGHFSILSY